jgi:hypothetical protein
VDNQSGIVGDLLKLADMTEQQATWIVPGYAAEELIGFGASGDVWRGRAMDTGEQVALKRLRAGAADQARRRLEREAALLARIDHPHLLRVRELVSTDHETVLVLDYAAGGSLAMLLRHRARLRPGEVVTVLAPVAAALAHAHGEGLLHGDVSPANVLFTADGRPLLADLGVARVLGERDDPQCTPEYMDPAVAAGAALGPASDVFMLAAVAMHALTGVPPWRGDSPEQTVALAATGRIPEFQIPEMQYDFAEVPAELLRVVRRALSADPSGRGSAAELALDLRHACTPEPVRLAHPAPASVGEGRTDGVDAAAALTHAVRVPPPLVEATVGETSLAMGPPRHRRDDRRRVGSPTASGEAGSGSPSRPGGRAGSIRRTVGAAIALLLAMLLGMAWGSSGSAERPADLAAAHPAPNPGRTAAAASSRAVPARSLPSTTRPPSVDPAARHWRAVLAALDGMRALAYERGDPALLQQVYVPGRHLRVDSARLHALVSAGDTARGVRHLLGPLDVLTASADHVRVRVVQSLPPSQRLHGGRPVAAIPGTPQTAVMVDLIATPAGWRLA